MTEDEDLDLVHLAYCASTTMAQEIYYPKRRLEKEELLGYAWEGIDYALGKYDPARRSTMTKKAFLFTCACQRIRNKLRDDGIILHKNRPNNRRRLRDKEVSYFIPTSSDMREDHREREECWTEDSRTPHEVLEEILDASDIDPSSDIAEAMRLVVDGHSLESANRMLGYKRAVLSNKVRKARNQIRDFLID